MNVRDYLDRIYADVDPEPTLATLRTLHRQHLYAAPRYPLRVLVVLDQDRILAEVARPAVVVFATSSTARSRGSHRSSATPSPC